MNNIFIAAGLLLAATLPAGASYEEALKASEALNSVDSKELTALLEKSGEELAVDNRAMQLLKENAGAMELFRQAAAAPNDGYLFAPRDERPTVASPVPKFGPHIKLFKLLLIDSKVSVSDERPQDSEKDLLAAAGFLAQTAGQKSAPLFSHMVTQLCLFEAWPQFLESLRGKGASDAYMAELARRLDVAAAAQDFLRQDMVLDGEILKNTVRDSLTKEKLLGELEKKPVLLELQMRRVMDDEFTAIVDKLYSGYVDAQVKAFVDAFAGCDPAMAELRLAELKKEVEAQRARYPKPAGFMALASLIYPTKAIKEAVAFAVYEKFASAGSPDYGKLIPSYHAFYNALNVLRTGLAVKRWQRASRRLPGSLEQLVPAYLPAVPQDTFNKRLPLMYLQGRRSFEVYSFGPDGADGGGREQLDMKAFRDDNARNAGDILFAS
jgi:hypothetical protein